MAPCPYSSTKWFHDQKAKLPLVTKDLSDKTVLVIGANVGLGFEASRHFARMKPKRLILACRNIEKGTTAAKDIEEDTGYSAEVAYVDLADFSTIPKFIEGLDDNGNGEIDIAICNAGVNMKDWSETKDGWESTIQINHLSTSLIALLLLPILARSKSTESSPRLTIVASEVHYFITTKKKFPEVKKEKILEALNDKKAADMSTRYFVSKLFNVFFVRALAEHLPQDSLLVVDAVNPGWCKSQLSRNFITSKVARAVFTGFEKMLARATEMGSRTLVHAALDGANRDVQGKYLNRCQVEEESDLVISEEGKVIQDRLWNETLDVLFKVHPQVKDVVSQYLHN